MSHYFIRPDENGHSIWASNDDGTEEDDPCTALGFWDTGLKPTPPERAVEAAACDIQPG
jgi:hypothetical protein